MTEQPGADLRIRSYVGALVAAVTCLLVWTSVQQGEWGSVLLWAAFMGLFVLTESATILFHHQSGKVGLSATEAVYLPMLVALTVPQLLWAVVLGAIGVNLFQLRRGVIKGIFNVANFGIAAGVGAAVYHSIAIADSFTPRTAVAAAVGVVAFNFTTHLLVAGAISLTGGGRFTRLFSEIAVAAALNLGINIVFGLLLAGSYFAARWTVLIFPFPIAAFFFSYRALLRDLNEAQRLEHLHAASRALATSPSLEDALGGFLRAVREVVSAREARAILVMPDGLPVTASIDINGEVHQMEPIEDGALVELLNGLTKDDRSFVLQGKGSWFSDVLDALGVDSAVAAPLVDGDTVVGCLLALDRIGADDFGPSEATMLEALGHELVLTLDSYRLFAQVSEERERFRRIFAASKEGICLLDDAGTVRAWNPALARITGYAAEDVQGRVWSDVLVVNDADHNLIAGMRLVATPSDQELEVTTAEGQPRWISVLSDRTHGANEDGWVVLVRDVTTEHIVEESKSDFLATISHELRTPLTTIKGSVQVLTRRREEQDPIEQQMLLVLQRGTDRLERLVLNLLFVSQLDVKEDVKLFVEDVDLARMVRHSVDAIASDHPDVSLTVNKDLVMARVDRERTSQVIDHLIENAVKFCPVGPISIEVGAEDDHAFLRVRDSGPGIPTVDQERIFERFVRLGHVLTRETQGPGIGLFIVKKAVEAMGGSVVLESRPGEGATFTVTFPPAAERPAEVERETV